MEWEGRVLIIAILGVNVLRCQGKNRFVVFLLKLDIFSSRIASSGMKKIVDEAFIKKKKIDSPRSFYIKDQQAFSYKETGTHL